MTDKSRKAVPREPTLPMVEVGAIMYNSHARIQDIWRAMYDAAPVLATAPAEPPKLRDAALAFLKKYDVLEPVLANLHFMEANRGRPYKGDTWEAEMKALRLAAGQLNDAGAVKNSSAPLLADKAPGLSQDYAMSGGVATPASPPPPGEVAALIERLRELDRSDACLTGTQMIPLHRNTVRDIRMALARLAAPVPDKEK